MKNVRRILLHELDNGWKQKLLKKVLILEKKYIEAGSPNIKTKKDKYNYEQVIFFWKGALENRSDTGWSVKRLMEVANEMYKTIMKRKKEQ